MLKKSLLKRILIIAALLFVNLQWGVVSASPVDSETQSTILFVKPGADGDCLSWDTACELQTALFTASEGDQIWVASGTYKPTTSSNREATFQLINGVAIYGGFPAEGGGWETRDWETNITTLSGDIGVVGETSDNSCTVVTSIGVDDATVLDGFTISGGNANESSLGLTVGGGMFNDSGNPTLTNVIFTNNVAKYDGGGMFNYSGSPTVTSVTFSGNTASTGGGMFNGGTSDGLSNPTLTDVTFTANTATYSGGGMYNWWWGSPILTNVTFDANTASSYGGGMYNERIDLVLTNVTFSLNTANSGGGMHNTAGSDTSMTNVTFSINSASFGGGMSNGGSSPTMTNVTFFGNTASSNGGGIYNDFSFPSLTNSILWGNTPDQISDDLSTVTYSDVQGGYDGVGNINVDPLLGSLADNGGFTQTHAIAAGSPAIDAADTNSCPDFDQRGVARPIDGDGDGTAICDMGAYEYVPISFSFYIYLPLILKN